MKNIQVITGYDNCTYSVYAVTDEEFRMLFPEAGQDVEFIEDVIDRVGDESLGLLMLPVWERPVSKPDVVGIHGTVFYQLDWKKKYYPTKRAAEMVLDLSPHQTSA